ncbi:bifunctional UDP-sugar hydrolase/5'-nucleotidase [Psychrobium sp. 1_MG-2023]|uniref:bifunctional metallophosphatase/5'-nucleotidase n=1 Tax=Psychrobium sp. 1_MG-2023 TaxID=3062624 RepID=UPI000C327E42|nr:bifunctional metallophosphatase/5'-nucleotidase [Psychrobium sp. 1_MG-2023]MDP2562417.1 bifunctional metallophosphatase/5'-nucleotidase [Psychrobium sp. 1_MG-2023]PKF56145.1 bifunctional metallophosphatase/5'-nucleotidase [Alteromonadales bacterium alter-6D02]
MSYSLYLAHVNDTHSHFEPSLVHFKLNYKGICYRIDAHCGGYAKVANALNLQREQAQQQNIPSLFLHAGDSFQGSLYFSQYKGKANSVLLNLLAPDAMTIGNHEFDLGNSPISQFIGEVEFPILAGNMDLAQESQSKPHPLSPHKNLYHYDNQRKIAQYITKPLFDKQLAIFGITLDQMAKIGCPDHDCLFLNAIETCRATVEHIKRQGINHIIVLSHLGYQGDLQLAEAVSDISVIVGGHSHTLTGDFSAIDIESTGIKQQFVNNCLILQAGKHAESMGLSKLTFNARGRVEKQEGGISLLIDKHWQAYDKHDEPAPQQAKRYIQQFIDNSALFTVVAPCKKIKTLINQQYRPAIDAMRHRIITHLDAPLHHTRLPTEDYPLGSEIAPLVSQGFYLAGQKDREIDFALHNAGGVRVSLKSGPLTQAEICGRLLPFEIQIISYVIKGHDLRLALEGAINNATNNGVTGTGDGSYPYCYHLRFEYDAEQSEGHRITRLEIKKNGKWLAVVADATYRGISSAYTIAGKEGYDNLLNSWDHFEHPQTMSSSFVEFAQAF